MDGVERREGVGWGQNGDFLDVLSVSMGALDNGPAAPATRPQRAVWILGRSRPSYIGCQLWSFCFSFV